MLRNEYRYNGRGERIAKLNVTTPTSTRYFVYDEEGRLLGEYQPGGGAVKEYVWLDDRPVAVLDSYQGQMIQYVLADHLGTPRAVVNPATDAIIWRWDLTGSAFGSHSVQANPDGDGANYALNLRYPGQYYDGESGLHYNYFRDYDPATGRYVQSDPIGLEGGLSTYGYVESQPLQLIDALGLQSVDPLKRHLFAHAQRGNWYEIEGTLQEVARLSAREQATILRQCAEKRGSALLDMAKRSGVGTGARSGQHGTPHARAGAELQREANELAKLGPHYRQLAEQMKIHAKRLLAKGKSVNHGM